MDQLYATNVKIHSGGTVRKRRITDEYTRRYTGAAHVAHGAECLPEPRVADLQEIEPPAYGADELVDVDDSGYVSCSDDEYEDELEDEDESTTTARPAAATRGRKDPFAAIRPQLQEQQLSNFVSGQLLWQAQVAADLQPFADAVGQPCCYCPLCGSWGQHQAMSSGSLPVAVLLCTGLAIHRISVQPLIRCSICSKAFRLSPLHVGCLPGTARAFTLRPRKGMQLLWFAQSLLAHLDTSHYKQGSSSIHTDTQLLFKQWERSAEAAGLPDEQLRSTGCLEQLPTSAAAPVSADSLRRQLGAALREYQYADSRTLTLCEALDGWPTPKHLPCGACLPDQLHAHFDVCFGLRHLSRGGQYTAEYAPPDNARRFIANANVQEELQAVDAVLSSRGQPREPRSGPTPSAADASLPGAPGVLAQSQPHQLLPLPPVQNDLGSSSAAAGGGAAQHAAAADQPAADQPADQSPAVDTAGACSNFNADKLTGSDNSKYTIKGVACTVCRHGHVLSMMNCFGGERHAYAILAFWTLLMAGILVHCWWYDINCRWKPSLLRWLQAKGGNMAGGAANTLFPVPPWHMRAHRLSCRVKHGHLHMPGAGRGTGEVCEQVNATLAPHGLITQYNSGPHREGRLERVVLLRERDLDADLPAQQVHKLLRAATEADANATKLQDAVATLQQLLDDAGQDAARWREHVANAQAALAGQLSSTSMDWRGEYVQCYLLLQQRATLPDAAADDAAPMSMLLPPSVVTGVNFTVKTLAAALATLTRLAAEHLGGKVEDMSHPDVREGFSQWLAATISTAEQQLQTTLSHAQYLELLIQKLRGRPRDKDKLIAKKRRLMEQVAAELTKLAGWAAWALRMHAKWQQQRRGTAHRWSLQPQLSQHLRELAGATLDALKNGEVALGAAGVAAAGVPAAAQQVHLLQLTERSLVDERNMLDRECARLQAVAAQRALLLRMAIVQLGAGDGGRRYVLLRELARAEALDESCSRLFPAAANGSEAALVAAVAVAADAAD